MKHLTKSCAVCMCLTILSGCTSTTTTNTARAAKEQLLISNAVDRALNKVNFAPLAGQRVFVEDKYLECVDKPYILGSIRHRVAREGARLASKSEEADIILEPRSGVVGTDMADTFLGVPEITLPGVMTLPEIRLANKEHQQGFAKLGMVVLDAKTGQVLGDGGVSLAHADDNNWYVMGMGPWQNGTIREEIGAAKGRQVGQPYRPLPNVVAFDSSTSSAPGAMYASEEQYIQQADEESPEEKSTGPYRFSSNSKFLD